jgi:VWFA-related protein
MYLEKRIMKRLKSILSLAVLFACAFSVAGKSRLLLPRATAQDQAKKRKASGPPKPTTIPVGIKVKGQQPAAEELRPLDLTVNEDGEPQTILSIRAFGTNSPITLAVLIQDDLVASVSNETRTIAEFLRHLPTGSRVMVGYIRAGSLQVRQKFTTDLEKAAASLRIPFGLASAAPYNPYVEVMESLNRFESQPTGRRSMLLISDGLDISRGLDSSSPGQSLDLQRAINQAQRRSVAIYSFYVPSVVLSSGSNLGLTGNAQSSLERLSTETGGKAYFQGTGAPVSFDPFFRDLNASLERQIALTYLSTHTNKGFHRIQLRSSTPGVELTYPSGYVR